TATRTTCRASDASSRSSSPGSLIVRNQRGDAPAAECTRATTSALCLAWGCAAQHRPRNLDEAGEVGTAWNELEPAKLLNSTVRDHHRESSRDEGGGRGDRRSSRTIGPDQGEVERGADHQRDEWSDRRPRRPRGCQ